MKRKRVDVYIFVNFGWIQIVFTGNLEFPLFSSRHLCLHSSVLLFSSLSTRAFLPQSLFFPLFFPNKYLCLNSYHYLKFIVLNNMPNAWLICLFTFLPYTLQLAVSWHLVIILEYYICIHLILFLVLCHVILSPTTFQSDHFSNGEPRKLIIIPRADVTSYQLFFVYSLVTS